MFVSGIDLEFTSIVVSRSLFLLLFKSYLYHYVFLVNIPCSSSFTQTTSSNIVQGFDSLRLLNLEDNDIADWGEILKLSQLKRYYKEKSFFCFLA